MIVWHVVCVQCSLCLRQSHAAHKLHSYAVHRPGHLSGQLAALFVLRLNVQDVFALIPQFTILHSNKECALYDSIFLLISAYLIRITVFYSLLSRESVYDSLWN